MSVSFRLSPPKNGMPGPRHRDGMDRSAAHRPVMPADAFQHGSGVDAVQAAGSMASRAARPPPQFSCAARPPPGLLQRPPFPRHACFFLSTAPPPCCPFMRRDLPRNHGRARNPTRPVRVLGSRGGACHTWAEEMASPPSRLEMLRVHTYTSIIPVQARHPNKSRTPLLQSAPLEPHRQPARPQPVRSTQNTHPMSGRPGWRV
jgi:hypothetical protein